MSWISGFSMLLIIRAKCLEIITTEAITSWKKRQEKRVRQVEEVLIPASWKKEKGRNGRRYLASHTALERQPHFVQWLRAHYRLGGGTDTLLINFVAIISVLIRPNHTLNWTLGISSVLHGSTWSRKPEWISLQESYHNTKIGVFLFFFFCFNLTANHINTICISIHRTT